MAVTQAQVDGIVDGLLVENLKLVAGAGGHALARTYQALADFDNIMSKEAAASFGRRALIGDLAAAKGVEDIRYPDAEVNAAQARTVERMLGHPTAETAANLGGGVAMAGMLFKALFSQPPSGWTFYPGPSGPAGVSPTPAQ